MTKHEFIFSDQRRHRIARHVVFWIAWWFAYLLFFHYPIFTFKGWGFKANDAPGTFQAIQKIGLPLFIFKTMMVNALLSVVLPQILFTYFLLYWLLPKYFYKKKKLFIVAVVITGTIAIYIFVASGFQFLNPLLNYIFRWNWPPSGLPRFLETTMSFTIRDHVTSLPIVASFAMMITLIKRWWLKQKENEQLARETSKAELQLLKAQIHPHFLFNTLNNIYFFTLTNSRQAPTMIKKLSGILQYIINECNRPLVSLEKEIQMIRDYMELEKIRYGEQMKMTITIDQDSVHLNGEFIAPLLLIPLVENSFKHGASKMIAHPWVTLTIKVEGKVLNFSIANGRPRSSEISLTRRNIGLKNVAKRLELLYPAAHELNLEEQSESFAVHLKIRLDEMSASLRSDEVKTTAYELA